MFDEFRTLTDAQLRVQYDRCRDDLVKLKALNQVLTHRRSEAALDLQIEVVADIRRLTRGVTTPIETWLRQFLLTRSLGRPDGRALHRYRLTDEEYAGAAKVWLVSTAASACRRRKTTRRVCSFCSPPNGSAGRSFRSSGAGMMSRLVFWGR